MSGSDDNQSRISAKAILDKVNTGPFRPRFKLPPGTVGQVEKLSRLTNKTNKVMMPLAIAIDVGRVGYAGYTDIQNRTSRNVVETTVSTAAGWAGGFGGAVGGAAIGSAIFPGVGTLIGSIVGAIAVGVAGSATTTIVMNAVGDAVDYDIEETWCEGCLELFKARKYKGEKYCSNCS